MARLAGKVAIVTGAASGIGAGTATVFAEHGARLILVDRDSAGLEVVRARLDTPADPDHQAPTTAGADGDDARGGLCRSVPGLRRVKRPDRQRAVCGRGVLGGDLAAPSAHAQQKAISNAQQHSSRYFARRCGWRWQPP